MASSSVKLRRCGDEFGSGCFTARGIGAMPGPMLFYLHHTSLTDEELALVCAGNLERILGEGRTMIDGVHVIDFHGHVGRDRYGMIDEPTKILHALDMAGIDQGVSLQHLSPGWHNGQQFGGALYCPTPDQAHGLCLCLAAHARADDTGVDAGD